MELPFCNFCHQKQKKIFLVRDFVSGDKFWLYQCINCGLGQTLPQPSKEVLSSRYYFQYRHFNGQRFFNVFEQILDFFYAKRVDKIVELNERKMGTILDVGFGRGTELIKLAKLGWDCFGTELRNSPVNTKLLKGIKVYNNGIWQIKFNKKFDVITFWHSLEHIYYPKKVLQTATKLLKKNGYLIIACPNFDSWEARIFGQHWFHLDVPRHLFHFSKPGLINILNNLKLKLVGESYHSLEYDFYGFWQSALNSLFPAWENQLYQWHLGKRLTFLGWLKIIIQVPFIVFLALISLVIVPALGFFGQNGTMVLILKNNGKISSLKKIS